MPEKQLIYSREAIAGRVADLGREITAYYQKQKIKEPLLVVGVLTGAVVFAADLMRALDLELEVDFVRLSSYQHGSVSSGKIVMTKDLEVEVRNRHVLVIEDIADYGHTLEWLMAYIGGRKPASLKVAVMVNKMARRSAPLLLDYVGFDVKDGFLVGYGLDYAGLYRNLPDIYHLSGI